MSAIVLALGTIAATHPELAYKALETAIAETFTKQSYPGEATDLSGNGFAYYSEMAMLPNGGGDPIGPAGVTVYHVDFYEQVVIEAVYADGARMLALPGGLNGFGVVKHPAWKDATHHGDRYETVEVL